MSYAGEPGGWIWAATVAALVLLGGLALHLRRRKVHAEAELQRARQAVDERDERMSIVGEIAATVSSALVPDELFPTIIDQLRSHVVFHRCAIGRRDRETGIHAHWWTWDDRPVAKLITEVRGPWEAAVIYDTLEPHYMPDLAASGGLTTRRRLLEQGLRSTLVVPIVRDGECIAHISMSSREVDGFTPSNIELLKSVSGYIAVALRNASLYEEVFESRQFYRSVVDESPDPIVILDDELRVRRWTPAAESLLGYPASDVDGKSVEFLLRPGGEVNPLLDVGSGSGPKRFETEFRAADGVDVPVEVSVFPVFHSKGRLVRACAIVKDLTDRRKTERELALYRADLERLVEERTGELERAQAEVVRAERLATLGQVTAVVSHELRNPLGSIKNSLETIESRAVHNQDLMRPVERAKRNVARCSSIITDLLDHARIELGRTVEVPLGPWLEDVVSELDVPSGATVHVEPGDATLTARLDVERMHRAMTNLVDNALQSVAGVGAGRREVEVTVGCVPRGDGVEIYVNDTGAGIPADIRDKIFEPLFSTKSFGVGLGLTIVREIVSQHGGHLSLEPREGGGTRARIWLPPADRAPRGGPGLAAKG